MGNCITSTENKDEIQTKMPSLRKLRIKSIFDVDIKDVDRFTFEGKYYYCRMDNIYDGDTADIYFLHDGKVVRHAFRFYGYDSAEMKQPKNAVNRDSLKSAALEDKKFLTSLVLDQKLIVHFMKEEKYGRLMGTVWKISDTTIPEDSLVRHPELTDSNNICNIMINSGHGKSYYGGHKE